MGESQPRNYRLNALRSVHMTVKSRFSYTDRLSWINKMFVMAQTKTI